MPELSQEEISQFVDDGFLTRQLSLSDAQIDALADMSWHHVTDMNPHFQRNNPDSWRGDVTDSCRIAAIPKRRGRVKLRECVQNEPLLRQTVFENDEVTEVIEGLLGPTAFPRPKPQALPRPQSRRARKLCRF